ncbi:MAG: hypothetical protein WD225_03050, partial [Ilumatobacteraceae bacterium]
MTEDARTPVVIGVAQRSDRNPDPDAPLAPLDLLTDEVVRAAEDAGGVPLSRVDTVVTIPVAYWEATNQVGALAARAGALDARLVHTGNGGEAGVVGINWIAREILAGRSSMAVLAGGNMMRSTELAGRRGQELIWTDDAPGEPHRLGQRREGQSEFEAAAGLDKPPHVYPLFENALRAHFGRSLDEHLAVVGRLFARFTDVAADNPHAWFPTARTADELVTPSPTNRMVAYPYTKYLNAILNTDQAGALIVTSVERARELGVPEDRWVRWGGGADAAEEAFHVSTRPDYAATPSMLDSHLPALAEAGVGLDDIALFDFYSCFPAAVEMAVRMLGLDLDDPRGFTVTGGLPYAGGPGSAYTLLSMAAMTERLRERPGDIGMVTGNGFYVTKHAASVWSTAPFDRNEEGWGDRPLPSSAFPTAPVEPVSRSGRGTVETYTV